MKNFTYTYWVNDCQETLKVSHKTGVLANEHFKAVFRDTVNQNDLVGEHIYIKNENTGSLSRANTASWFS